MSTATKVRKSKNKKMPNGTTSANGTVMFCKENSFIQSRSAEKSALGYIYASIGVIINEEKMSLLLMWESNYIKLDTILISENQQKRLLDKLYNGPIDMIDQLFQE